MLMVAQDHSHGSGELGVIGHSAPNGCAPGDFFSRQAVGTCFGQDGMDRLSQRSRSRRPHWLSLLGCGVEGLHAIRRRPLDLRVQIGKFGGDAGVKAQLVRRHLPELRDRQLGVLWWFHKIQWG